MNKPFTVPITGGYYIGIQHFYLEAGVEYVISNGSVIKYTEKKKSVEQRKKKRRQKKEW